MSKGKRILVIGAHPDDEVLGCGGTIAKLTNEGNLVYVLIITIPFTPKWDAKYINKKMVQQKQVDSILCISHRFQLDYKTLHLNTIPHYRLAEDIEECIKHVKPDIIFTHFDSDLNLDHQTISFATKVAGRNAGTSTILMYEVLSSTNKGMKAFKPNYYVALGKNEIIRKINAYKIYAQEIKTERTTKQLESLALLRGADINKNHAEAFKLWRHVE